MTTDERDDPDHGIPTADTRGDGLGIVSSRQELHEVDICTGTTAMKASQHAT